MSETLRSRRSFLKTAAASAAGLAVAGPAVKSVLGKTEATGWTNGMAINPNIDNLRVVCMVDSAMITNAKLASYSLDTYTAATSRTQILSNMDKMAMSLAQKTTAADAWSTIFQKPASKTWAQVIVAIKINTCSTVNMARIAVVEKVCTVLNGLGVPGANISIYDTTCNPGLNAYKNYFSATGTGTYNGYTKIPGVVTDSLGGTTPTAVPNRGNVNCITNLANGTVDILVNIAVNKGHMISGSDGNTGGVTLCFKNHFGTFPPVHSSSSPTTAAIAEYYSMSNAIVGGTPPRQQLCIVDSLWADNALTPTANPTSMPARLVMGTFAGAVDYLTSLNIRKPSNLVNATQMDWTQINTFLTAFGYTTTDPNLKWVEITPVSTLPGETASQQPRMLEVRLAGSAAMTKFALPHGTGSLEIAIFDIRGRSIKKMFIGLQGERTSISWDGKNEHGQAVASGIYEVRISAGGHFDAGKIMIE